MALALKQSPWKLNFNVAFWPSFKKLNQFLREKWNAKGVHVQYIQGLRELNYWATFELFRIVSIGKR
jgi:hypothetical protein